MVRYRLQTALIHSHVTVGFVVNLVTQASFQAKKLGLLSSYKTKLRGLSPRANYKDSVTSAWFLQVSVAI
jgi:hypothetical protein